MSTPATLPLTIRRGVTFRHSLIFESCAGVPIDLTGYRGRMQIRSTRSGDDLDEQIVYCTLDSLLVEDGTITFDPAPDGQINLQIPALVTKTFTWATAEYDLLIVYPNGIDVDVVAEGQVIMAQTVTNIP